MFRCDKRRYKIWLATLDEAGLKPSPGKNFFHKKFGTVNSALFHRPCLSDRRYGKEYAEYIPFFNAGMLLGQSKVARVEEGRFKPIHCLHQSVLHGAINQIRADMRFKYYNLEELVKCSTLPCGTQLNWYLPRSMGGLGMKLPIGASFGEDSKSSNHVVTYEQRKLAFHLRELWYADELMEPPFKPIGLPVDLDKESWGCDIRKKIVYQAQLRSCPQLPYCEDVIDIKHPPNWYLRDTGAVDTAMLQFDYSGFIRILYKQLRKVKQSDRRLLDLDNAHLYDDIILYKKRTDRRLLSLPALKHDATIIERLDYYALEDHLDHNGIVKIDYLLN
jgi:hypothetical protein